MRTTARTFKTETNRNKLSSVFINSQNLSYFECQQTKYQAKYGWWRVSNRAWCNEACRKGSARANLTLDFDWNDDFDSRLPKPEG